MNAPELGTGTRTGTRTCGSGPAASAMLAFWIFLQRREAERFQSALD